MVFSATGNRRQAMVVIPHRDTKQSELLLDTISRYQSANLDPVSQEQKLWERYGVTVAALVLDSSGFSRVTASHGIVHRLSTLVAMRDLCAPLCREHQCRSLQFHADNLFAVFDHVPAALASAMAIHRGIYRAGLMLTSRERLRVSAGIGYGPMLYCGQQEGYFSSEMNFASKLGEDIAAGDETLLTENAFCQLPVSDRETFQAASNCISGNILHYFRHRFLAD
jgi:class 3 adenylate cyclase